MSDEPNESDKRTNLNNSYEHDAIQAFGQLINISNGNILHEPTCPICNSVIRSDIEQAWVTSQENYDAVKKVIKDKTGTSIPKSVIENHMLYHFNREIREHQKKEYVDRIQRLTTETLTTGQRLNIGLAALNERLTGINSIVPSGDVSAAEVEKIKSTETTKIVSAQTNLLKLKNSIETEMRKTGELVVIPRQSFIDIFNAAIADAKTDNEKASINNILVKITNLSAASQ